MNLIRLDPPLYVVTPLGDAEAHFLQVPNGHENHATYGCFQLETGENWWWPNPLVRLRLAASVTGQRAGQTGFQLDAAYLDKLKPHVARHRKSPLYVLL